MNRTTKECRHGKVCEPVSPCESAKCLLLHSERHIDEIAPEVGKSEGYLRKASNCDYEGLELQFETVCRATKATGNLVAARYLAAQAGAAVVVLPTGNVAQSDILIAFTAAIEEAGKDGGAIQRALQNNHVSTDEAVAVGAEIDRTIAAFLTVRELVVAKAAKGGRA